MGSGDGVFTDQRAAIETRKVGFGDELPWERERRTLIAKIK